MLLKYLDGPHKILEWGNKTKYFLFRPFCDVPDEFGKAILAQPEKAGRFEEVKPVTIQTEGVALISATSFVCDVCQKPAKTRAGLAAHKRSHKNEVKG